MASSTADSPSLTDKMIKPSDEDPSASAKLQQQKSAKRNAPNQTEPPKTKNQNAFHPKIYRKLGLTNAQIYKQLADYVVPSKQLKDLGYPTDFEKSTAYIEPKKAFNNSNIYPLNIGAFAPCAFIANQIDVRTCCRCRGQFFAYPNGDYLSLDPCVHHWGKLSRSGKENEDFVYSCCNGASYTPGCSVGRLHVSLGATSGYLGGFVSTKPAKDSQEGYYHGIYAVDCEMCYTTQGLDLVKVSLVRPDGSVAYDELVKPTHPIIDYNTRFSGMTEKRLSRATKTLKQVQKELLKFVHAETILIGHSLENDLRALRLAHSTVVDTSILFPHFHGMPFRRSLKSLVSSIFKKDIQGCVHNSVEDARASLELVLWRLRKDFKSSQIK